LKLLEEKRVTALPDPEIFELILTRDTQSFDLNDRDSAQEKQVKQNGLQMFNLMFDFYVEKMLASCAGSKVWGPNVKYSQEVSQCLMPNSDKALRITTSTEAFTVLIYKNCWKKWNAMHRGLKKFRDDNTPGTWVCPRYNKKTKENPEYETPYTDQATGQKKIGGYTQQGMVEFMRLQQMVANSRRDNKVRVAEVERASIQRLRDKNGLDSKNTEPSDPTDGDQETANWDNFFIDE
jgi:hypothetical protein